MIRFQPVPVSLKSVLSLLLILTLVISTWIVLPTDVQALTYGDFEYVLINNGSEVEISRYIGPSGDVIMPNVIEGKPVTSIGDEAFLFYHGYGYTGTAVGEVHLPDTLVQIGNSAFNDCFMTTLTLPASVRTIGASAFSSCNNLVTVHFSEGLESIGGGAFYQCGLTEVTLPNSLKSIGSHAFGGNSIINATIPAGVETLGEQSFSGSSAYGLSYNYVGPQKFTVDANNRHYSSDESGVLFNKDKSVLLEYPVGKGDASYAVPASVRTIGPKAFYSEWNLTFIDFPMCHNSCRRPLQELS